MKTSMKIKIGLSIAAVATITTAVIASEKLIEKGKHAANRHKVKRFIGDKFDGNDKLLDIVDHLSDEDLDSVFKIMDKIKQGRKQITVYGTSLKDSTEDLKDKLEGFIAGLR